MSQTELERPRVLVASAGYELGLQNDRDARGYQTAVSVQMDVLRECSPELILGLYRDIESGARRQGMLEGQINPLMQNISSDSFSLAGQILVRIEEAINYSK